MNELIIGYWYIIDFNGEQINAKYWGTAVGPFNNQLMFITNDGCCYKISKYDVIGYHPNGALDAIIHELQKEILGQ